jgi:hypothetical protein
MSVQSHSDNLTVRIFEDARGKIPMEVMIEHTDAFDWIEVSNVADIDDICAIGGRLPWDYEVLSNRTDITPELVLQTLDKDWHWGAYELSYNPAITPELVLQTLDKDWHWGTEGLSHNPAITPQLVLKTLDRCWNWGKYGLSRNPAITPELVLKTLDKGWSWGSEGLSHNPTITPQLVLATKNKPWCEYTKVWAFRSMSLMKKAYTQWVHATYAPGSKRAVEIITNLERGAGMKRDEAR